ncbi:MAG TPA: alpha/beta hydrolase, partial [Acidimicrobiales bacterium]|nr:alpha/beta hydrolase [Acidimicrobiales bacterium]
MGVFRQRIDVPVTVSGVGTVTIATWLSIPETHDRDLLQVLVHGATYNHIYWDFPYQPETYSYVAWADGQGFATLAIDQLGVGESSRPRGELLTHHCLAESLHRLVDIIRGPGIGGHSFRRVVSVGHSAGSLASGLEAGTYGDVDGVVLTGILGPNASGIVNDDKRILGAFVPVADDPILRHLPVAADPGYMTLLPQARVPLFYRVPPADPTLIVVDETLKDVMTVGQWATHGDAAEACGSIPCPTLVINGQYDAFHFDPGVDADIGSVLARAERAAPAHYTFAPPVADMGHNLNQHPEARGFYESIGKWLRTTLL